MSNSLLNTNLFIKTPLIESVHLSEYLDGNTVLLKLENCQPPGSFKIRGISRACQHAVSQGCEEIIISSGGNGGLATAYAARKLGVKCRIVVPSMTQERMRKRIEKEGAIVEVYGETSIDVTERARELASESPKRICVHPSDDPIIWEGHSTMIDEIAEEINEKPSLVITCCGGGGLLCGIIQGMRRAGWTSVPVLAMETKGADSFNAAVKAGGVPVKIPGITSIATSIGCVIICDQLASDYRKALPPILSHVVDDREAVDACLKFADYHNFIVEATCGAVLAGLYNGFAKKIIADLQSKGPVVVIVCGGSAYTPQILDQLKKQFNL